MLAGLLSLSTTAPVYAAAPSQEPPENHAPVFGEGAGTTRRLAENPAAGQDIPPPISATDPDGHRLTYRLAGEDAEVFALDPRNGRLRTRDGVVYDHEVRDRYAVIVQAEDGHGSSSAIAVVIEVTNVLEPPSPPDAPTATDSTRDTLTVRWTPPANAGPVVLDYEGRYGVAGSAAFEGGWDRVGAITEATIEGLTGDTVYEVQVRARNGEGTGGWSESLEARTEPNRDPEFREGAAMARLLHEDTAAGVNVGAPVAATDPDGDRLVYSLEGDESAFSIDPDMGQLRTRAGVIYDSETRPDITETVKVEDGHGGSATAMVAVFVADEDDAPTADAGWDLTVAAGGTAWLDGTASRAGVGTLAYSWSFVSWPGSAPPALEGSTGATPSFAAAVEGTYVVRLTVNDGLQTAVDEVRVTVRPSTAAGLLVTADLLVDTNRDGLVDQSDEAGEAVWGEAGGAVFAPNADDDDEDGARDGWDARSNGGADLLDMAPVVVRRIPGLHRNHTVALEMEHAATSDGPQLFHQAAGGAVELLIGGDDRRAELPLERLVAGDLRLYIDSRHGRRTGFDGQLSLTLTVAEGGTTTSRDSVALQGSPILFSHHLQPAERVFVVDVPTSSTTSHNTALLNALTAHLPASTELYRLEYARYNQDRWIQDSMQTGYAQRAAEDGAETPAVHTQLHRGRGLERFLPRDYLGPEAGYVYPGGEDYSYFNYGGNVEVIPPHTHDDETYSFGRIVVGGGATSDYAAMAQRQIDFFESQSVQGPAIVVDTSWLWVAHVDEIFSVLPNRGAAPGERPWVVAIGSPALAVELLEEAVEKGFGDAPVFEGRGGDETTPREMLADSRLMTVNDYAQARIDTVRDELIAEVGLAEADFREVPALFEAEHDWSYGRALVALVPSMQNLLVVDDLLFVPDPEGPDADGTDVWRQATLDAVEGLGLTTHFVDVYNSYHVLSGGIHCGTNVERAGSTTGWWVGAEDEDSP